MRTSGTNASIAGALTPVQSMANVVAGARRASRRRGADVAGRRARARGWNDNAKASAGGNEGNKGNLSLKRATLAIAGRTMSARGSAVTTRVLFGQGAKRAVEAPEAIELEAPANVAKECFYEESYIATQRVRVANALMMKVETNGVRYRVSVETDLASENLLLHWGMAPSKENWDQWKTPPENIRPPFTKETVGVCQTLFTQTQTGRIDQGDVNCVIEGDIKDGQYAINFVLFDKKLEQWLHQEKGGFFHVPLPQPPKPEVVIEMETVLEEYEEEVEEVVYDQPAQPIPSTSAARVEEPKQAEKETTAPNSSSSNSAASRLMSPPVDPKPLADKTDFGPFASGIQAMKSLLRGGTFDIQEVLKLADSNNISAGMSGQSQVDEAVVAEPEPEPEPERKILVEGPVAPPEPKVIKRKVKNTRAVQRETRKELPLKLIEGSWVITSTVEEIVHNEKEVQYTIGALVEKDPEGGGVRLRVEAEVPWNLVLHWGIIPRGARADVWSLPPESWRPMGSSVFKDKACETPMKRFESPLYGLGTLNYTELELGNAPTAVRFVLKELNGTRWIDRNGDDFVIPMPEAVAPSSVLDANSQQDMQAATSVALAAAARAAELNLNTVETVEIKVKKEVEAKVDAVKVAPELKQEVLAKTPQVVEGPKIEVRNAPEIQAPPTPEPVPIPVKTASSRVTSAVGNGREILLQGFNWESSKSPSSWYANIENLAETIGQLGFTVIWLPPPTDSVSAEGYMPRDYYDLNSRYGTVDQLKSLISAMHKNGVMTLGDAVLNHRCAHSQGPEGLWNQFGGKLAWDARAIVSDDPNFGGKGSPSDGDFFHAAPNVDHRQSFVKADLEEWMQWLQKEVGYDGWRLDFVRGFWGGHVKDYMEATKPGFAVGEFWDALDYKYDAPEYNQDAHRQRIVNWINAAGGLACAFDVTTKGILHAVFERQEYWRLSDKAGKPPGVMGWWPSRAVTFVENHDTGSTQGHWRFPRGKELQGYAYILTHPGTPTVFWDHIFDNYWGHLHDPIKKMIRLRQDTGVHCRSKVSIVKCEQSVYAAVIDDMLLMKIGPGDFHADGAWKVVLSGPDFCIWTKK